MYSYIVTEGERIVGAWQTEWDSYHDDVDNPHRKIVRISDDEYAQMYTRLEEFSYKGKLKEKTLFQKSEILEEKHKPSKIEELEVRIANLEKKVNK